MEDHSKIVCYKRKKRHLKVGDNTQVSVHGPRIVAYWSLSENDPEANSRFPKIQQRSSKMRLRGQMSTIVEESYSMYNAQKNEHHHKQDVRYIKTLKLDTSSCTISNMSTGENSSAATSQDVESISLGSKAYTQGRSHTAPNIKKAEPPSKFRKRKRKRVVKRSMSNSDIYTNYTVCPMQIELPKMQGSTMSLEKTRLHGKDVIKDPIAANPEAVTERKNKSSKDNVEVEADSEKKYRHSKSRKDKDKDKEIKPKEKIRHKHRRVDSEEVPSTLKEENKSKDNKDKIKKEKKKKSCGVSKHSCMKRLLDKEDPSFSNICLGVIKKTTITRSELGSLEIPEFKKKTNNEHRGLMIYNANKKVVPSTDLILHPNLIFAGIVHKDTSYTSTNSIFGSSRHSILQSSWMSTYDSSYISWPNPSESFYDLNVNSLALLSDLSSTSGIQEIKSDEQCNFTTDCLQKALNEINQPSVKGILEGFYKKPMFDCQEFSNPYCYISLKDDNSNLNRGTNTDISWTNFFKTTLTDQKQAHLKIPTSKREKSECSDARNRSRIPRYKRIDPTYRTITCATLSQKTTPEEKEAEAFEKYMSTASRDVVNLEEEMFEFTFSEPSLPSASDVGRINKAGTLMKSETFLLNFPGNKIESKQSNVSIISFKENVVVTKTAKVTEGTHSVSIQVYVPPQQVDAVTSITSVDTKSRSKLPIPVASIKSKQSVPSHTIPIEIDLKRASQGNVKAHQAATHPCDNGQDVKNIRRFFSHKKRKSRKRPKLAVTEFQNLFSFYDSELISVPASAISMFPSFKSIFVEDATFEIESISFIGLDTNEIIMRAMEFAQPLHPHLEEDISAGKIKVENDDNVPLNLPITTTQTGLSYYTFRSILRKYLAHRDTLQMLTPIVRGHVQKAPKVDSALLIDPVPVLEKISSIEFRLEDQAEPKEGIVVPDYLEQGFDDSELVPEELPEQEREIRNLVKNKEFIYEILHDVSESESEKSSAKGSCSCMPCLCSKDTDFLIEYQRTLDQQKEKSDVANSILDDLLKKIYSDVDARTRRMVSDILKDLCDEITGIKDRKGRREGVSFCADRPLITDDSDYKRTKPIKRCICGGEKSHPGPCQCSSLVPAKRKCDFKNFHDRYMHLSKQVLRKHRATSEMVDDTEYKKQTSTPETCFHIQIEDKKDPKNKVEMERRYIKNDISHDSFKSYTEKYEKTPPILWTLARRFLWKKQPEIERRASKRRRPNFGRKITATSSSASSSKRVFTAALLHSATSFDRKELMNFAPKYKKRKIEETVPKMIKKPRESIKIKKAIKQVPSFPVTILKKPPYGPTVAPENIPNISVKNQPEAMPRNPSPKGVSTNIAECFAKNIPPKTLITLVPPKQNTPKGKSKVAWTVPRTSAPADTTKQISSLVKCISRSSSRSEPNIPSKNIPDDPPKFISVGRETDTVERITKKGITNDIPKIVNIDREKCIVERMPKKAIPDDAQQIVYVDRGTDMVERKVIPNDPTKKVYVDRGGDLLERIPKKVKAIKDVNTSKRHKKIAVEQEAPVVKFPRIGHPKSFKDTEPVISNRDVDGSCLKSTLQTTNDLVSKTTTIGISTTGLLTPTPKDERRKDEESLSRKKRLDKIANIDESNKENKKNEIPSHYTGPNENSMWQAKPKLNILTSKDYSTKCERKSSKMAEAQTNLTYKNRDTSTVSTQITRKNHTHSPSSGRRHSLTHSSAGAKQTKHHKNKAKELEADKNSADNGQSKILKNKENSSGKDGNNVGSISLGENRRTESISKQHTELKSKELKQDINPAVSIKESVERHIESLNQNKLIEKNSVGTGKETPEKCKLSKKKEESPKRSKASNSSTSQRKNKENFENIESKSPNENIEHVDSKSKKSRKDKKSTTSKKESSQVQEVDTQKKENNTDLNSRSKSELLKVVTPEITKYSLNKENFENIGSKSPNENIEHVDSKSKKSRKDKKSTTSKNESAQAQEVDTQKKENNSDLNSRSKSELLKVVTPEITKYSNSAKTHEKSHRLKYYDEDKQVNAVQHQEPLFFQKTEATASLELQLQRREKIDENVKVESKQNLSIVESGSRPSLEDIRNFSINATADTEEVTEDVEAASRNSSSRFKLEKVISRETSLRLNISCIFDEVSKTICSKNVDSKIIEMKSRNVVDQQNSFEKDMILAMSEIWKKAIKSKSLLSTTSKAALIDEMALIFDQLQGKSLQNVKVESENFTVIQKNAHNKHSSTFKNHADSNKKSAENQLTKLVEIPHIETWEVAHLEASPALSKVKNSSSISTLQECKPVSKRVKKHKLKASHQRKIDSVDQTCSDNNSGILPEIKKKNSNYKKEIEKTAPHSLAEIENNQDSKEHSTAEKPLISSLPDKSSSSKNVVSVFTMFPSKTIRDVSAGRKSYFEDLPLASKNRAPELESTDVKVLDHVKVDRLTKKSQDVFAESPSSLRKATNKIINFDSLHKAIKNDLEKHHVNHSDLLQNKKAMAKRKTNKILINISSSKKVRSFNFDTPSIKSEDVNNIKTRSNSPQKYTVAHVVTNERIFNNKNQGNKKCTSSTSDTSEHSIVTLFKDMFRSNKSKKSEEASNVAIKLNDDLFVQNFPNSRLSTIVENTEQTHTPPNRRTNKMKGRLFCVPRNEIKTQEKIVYVVPRDSRPNVLSKLGGQVTKFMLSSSKFFSKKTDKSSEDTEILEEKSKTITKTKERTAEKRSKPSLRTINSEIPSLVSFEALYENIMSLKSESAREEEKRKQLERATEELEKNITITQRHFEVKSVIDTGANHMKDSFKELLQNVQEDIWSKLQEEKPFSVLVNGCTPSYENVSRRLDLPKLEISLEEFRETLKKERSDIYQNQSMRDTCGICYNIKDSALVNQKEHSIDADDTLPISIYSDITIPSHEEFRDGDCDLLSLLDDSYELAKSPNTSYRSAEKEYILNVHNYEDSDLLDNAEFDKIFISKPTLDSLVSTEASSDFVKYYIIPQ